MIYYNRIHDKKTSNFIAVAQDVVFCLQYTSTNEIIK